MTSLMRLIPLLVDSKLNEDDQTWGLLTFFIQILEKLCVLSFNHKQLNVLTSQIEKCFKKIFKMQMGLLFN